MLRTYRRSERRAKRFDVSSMCRMCLTQNLPSDKLVDIFVEEPLTNVSVIEFCTGIECEEDDGLPPKMCCNCYNSLTTFFAFKKMCQASDQYCKAFRDAPTITDEPLVNIETVDPKEEPRDELSLAENNDMGLLETDSIYPGAPDEVLLQIKKCEEDYHLAHPDENQAPEAGYSLPASDWEEEELEEEEEEEDDVEFLPHFQQQQQQQQRVNTDSLAPNERQKAVQRRPVMSCMISVVEPSQPVCPPPVPKPGHIKPPEERPRKASPAKRSQSLEGIVVATAESPFVINLEEKKYYCDLCSKVFLAPNSLKRHIKNHGSAQFKCPQCGKEFHQRSSMKRHLLLHSDRRFVCSACSKVLLSREGLKCHIRTQHTERTGRDYYKYRCTHCSKMFAHSSGLSRHMAIHRGISYACEACGKKFNDSSQLKRHKSKNHSAVDSDPSKGAQNTERLRPPQTEPAATAVA